MPQTRPSLRSPPCRPQIQDAGAGGNRLIHPRDDRIQHDALVPGTRILLHSEERPAPRSCTARLARVGRPDALWRGSGLRRARASRRDQTPRRLHQRKGTGGLVRLQGYAVIVIDAYHFGRRAPRAARRLAQTYDPATLDDATLAKYDDLARQALYLGVRELNWAGTTWAGVNFGDDSRCVDYLLSRKEVDGTRIGCTGLSGGGWRTNMIAALEPRVKATVSVGWMTTGDTQQAYNLAGAIGTFCLLPGVWNRLDVPDLIAMAAPRACMVVGGTEDVLFPPLGQKEATRQIAEAFAWAGSPDLFRSYSPAKPHCYDQDIQEEALAWFNKHLKAGKK